MPAAPASDAPTGGDCERAWRRASTPFCSTLDYIFLSRGDWTATRVRELPKRDAVLPGCSSYPTASEPSDHVAIWADVELLPPGERAAIAPPSDS